MKIDWIQVITIILGSGVISAFLTGFWLNVRTEKIKAQLQEKLYEFQTKFSLIHQQRMEAIKELCKLIVDIEFSLPDAVNPTQFGKWEEIEAGRQQAFNTCLNFHKYFLRNEIFLEENMAESIKVFDDSVIEILSLFQKSWITRNEGVGKLFDDKTSIELWGDSFRKAKKELSPIKTILKTQFRQHLFAEIPEYKIEEK